MSEASHQTGEHEGAASMLDPHRYCDDPNRSLSSTFRTSHPPISLLSCSNTTTSNDNVDNNSLLNNSNFYSNDNSNSNNGSSFNSNHNNYHYNYGDNTIRTNIIDSSHNSSCCNEAVMVANNNISCNHISDLNRVQLAILNPKYSEHHANILEETHEWNPSTLLRAVSMSDADVIDSVSMASTSQLPTGSATNLNPADSKEAKNAPNGFKGVGSYPDATAMVVMATNDSAVRQLSGIHASNPKLNAMAHDAQGMNSINIWSDTTTTIPTFSPPFHPLHPPAPASTPLVFPPTTAISPSSPRSPISAHPQPSAPTCDATHKKEGYRKYQYTNPKGHEEEISAKPKKSDDQDSEKEDLNHSKHVRCTGGEDRQKSLIQSASKHSSEKNGFSSLWSSLGRMYGNLSSEFLESNSLQGLYEIGPASCTTSRLPPPVVAHLTGRGELIEKVRIKAGSASKEGMRHSIRKLDESGAS